VQFASEVTEDFAWFRLAGPDDQGADEVRLWLDLRHDVEPRPLQRVDAGWEVVIERPPVRRVEYLFVLRHGSSDSMVVDPSNPLRARTAFGDHSVLEFPGYRAPGWLVGKAAEDQRTSFSVIYPGLLRPLSITICAPPQSDARESMPLLAVHDGPEFDVLAGISRFSASMIDSGRLPRHRLALLAPADRNRWYSALPAYADALHRAVLPAIETRVATNRKVLLGASLGGLAALHAAMTTPGHLDGLFLQSGSFFDRSLDARESTFGGFESIVDFVESVPDRPATEPIQIGMTCGLVEENLANNEQMSEMLAARGNQVELSVVPDAHTYTGWRDALDPHLVELLCRAWDPR
jgi:enterochelin esterase-like enzyme